MKYAIDFALVGRISGIRWNGKEKEEFKLKSLKEKLDFLDSLRTGDELYLASGGLSSEIAKIACQKGVRVALISGVKVKKVKRKGESTALVLKRLSEERPEEFNIWLPEEAEILHLTIRFSQWEEIMSERKATANRIRRDFYQRVLRNPNYKELSIEELREIAKGEIEKDFHYRWLLKKEKELKKELKEIVTRMPLYQEVFEDLDGCGPLIAARLIIYIRRIDRFPKWENLASYAGFGLKNGKKQKRKKGESLNYHPQLRSTIQYLWIKDQLLHWRRGALAYQIRERIKKEVKDKRIGIDKPGTPTGRAIWWMGRKLIRKIYYKWRAFEKENIQEVA